MNVRTPSKRLLTWLIFVVCMATAPSARAQALASDVYADAKDIITELIERDAAESISGDLGCYSPNGLLKYFPNTLQAVYERNFGAIKDQLRSEVIWFVSNYAFECFRQQRTIPLDEFLPITSFDPLDSDTSQCRRAVADAGGPANYQDRVARDIAARAGTFYYPVDRCDEEKRQRVARAGNASEDSRVIKVLCPYVATLRSAASVRPKDGVAAFAETAASIAYSDWLRSFEQQLPQDNTKVVRPARGQAHQLAEHVHATLFEELLQRVTTGRFPDDSLLAVYGAEDLRLALSAIDVDYRKLWDQPRRLRVLTGALRLLTQPGLPPDVSVDHQLVPDVTTLLKTAEVAALVEQPGEVPGSALARAILAHGGVAASGQVVVQLDEGGVDLVRAPKGAGPAQFVGSGLARLVEIQAMAREALRLEGLLVELGVPTDGSATPLVKVIVKATIGLVEAADETLTALKAIPRTQDGSIDLITLLDAIIRPKADSGFCPQGSAPAFDAGAPVVSLTLCGVLQQAVATLDPEALLLPILSAALQRDYRKVAVTVTDSLFSRASIETICCGKPESCSRIAELYGRLAKSIVSYVLMPRGDEDQSIAARAAFKSAVVDVLRELGRRGGVERRGVWPVFLLPTASLRASWSSSYQVSDTGKSGVRFVPTVDFPTARLQVTSEGATPYVGFAFNLFDPLALLTEVVSRDAASATHTANKNTTAWATMIHPRASVLVAMPALTKNTALVLSAGLRGAGVFDVGGEGSPERLYSTIFGTPRTRSAGLSTLDLVWPLVELSAGVQYVP